MKENKAMAQEIEKKLILHPKASKDFYHHIKILETKNEEKVFYKKTVLNNFVSTEKYLC